jgi:signal transduction histidine kinase
VVLGRQSEPSAVWSVQVADEGTGVPVDYRERIFEPFFRVPGRAEHEGSTGLGLSLVRQIAELHGGRVRCDTTPQGGCLIEWTIPVAAA